MLIFCLHFTYILIGEARSSYQIIGFTLILSINSISILCYHLLVLEEGGIESIDTTKSNIDTIRYRIEYINTTTLAYTICSQCYFCYVNKVLSLIGFSISI